MKTISGVLRGFIIATVISLLACDGFTVVKGEIRDSTGQPVEGAKIVLRSESTTYREEKSAQDGSYLVHTANAPVKFKMTLIVSKEGFKTYKKEFDSNQEYVIDVGLEAAQ